jgi:membrane-bound serine protease (ClpP class)
MVLETQQDARITDGTDLPQPGREGTARTPLRPSGTATFGEQRCDVMSQGTYIEAGARVRVVAVNGGRVIVAPFEGS